MSRRALVLFEPDKYKRTRDLKAVTRLIKTENRMLRGMT